MRLGPTGLAIEGVAPPYPALLRARSVYVDSVAGNDVTGDGSAGKPWKTIDRMWRDRQNYLQLRALYHAHLIGVGPYVVGVELGPSACGDGGRFVLEGDPAAYNVLATGTFTGAIASFVAPTSAIGGAANLYRNEFLQVTSGANAGAIVQIASNDASTITVCRTVGVANGDTWQIIRPGTEVRAPAGSVGAFAQSWTGCRGSSIPRHMVFGVRFTTTTTSISSSQAVFGFVRFESAVAVSASLVRCGFAGTVANALSTSTLLLGAGAMFASAFIQSDNGNLLSGFFSFGAVTVALFGAIVVWDGGASLASTFTVRGGSQLLSGSGYHLIAGNGITLGSTLATSQGGRGYMWLAFVTGKWVFAVTSGNCFTVDAFGELVLDNVGANLSGGTSLAGGFGVDVRGGGRVVFRNMQPPLTGGTLNQDLRTTNVTAANSVLSANGTAAQNATDTSLGELIARL